MCHIKHTSLCFYLYTHLFVRHNNIIVAKLQWTMFFVTLFRILESEFSETFKLIETHKTMHFYSTHTDYTNNDDHNYLYSGHGSSLTADKT